MTDHKQFWKATIYTTLRCTMSCERCGQRWLDARTRPDLTWGAFEAFVRGLRVQNVPIQWITLTGGEPTLWPHLSKAIDFAHDYGLRVIVFSNGLRRTARDYGRADIVQVTHYGSNNGDDRLRLKRELGKRLRIFYSIQIDTPLPDGGEESLPAECACPGLALFDGRVYPCPAWALRAGPEAGFDVEERTWFYAIKDIDPRTSVTCRTCLANEKVRRPLSPPLTIEGGLWESTRGVLWQLPWRGEWLRVANRRFRRWKMRRRIKGVAK